MENLNKLVDAVLKVMDECQGIDKNTTVGDGNYSYKGVSDKDVKVKIGGSMRKNGLIIVPTKIESLGINKSEWVDGYGKPKRSFFTEIITTYKLIHKDGASIDLAGYGHGVDTQDKGAGKATTYALKYTLLYTFLVATGYIDDTDNTHSNDIETPKKEFNQADLHRLAERKDVFVDSADAIEKIGEKWGLNEDRKNKIRALYE